VTAAAFKQPSGLGHSADKSQMKGLLFFFAAITGMMAPKYAQSEDLLSDTLIKQLNTSEAWKYI
jgi:hypothetical protein